jgi:hypothetical protein
MKKIFTLLLLFVASIGFSQNSGITYQAVIYGPNGQQLPGANNQQYILANKTICLRFSIIDQLGNVEYQETIVTTTDKFGMVNLLIGTGTQVSGYAPNFAGIVWNANTKSLKVELDPSQNCQNFTQISNNPFTYVPFAYYSANPGEPGPPGPVGPAGPAGPQGIQGIAGATGPQGIPGSNGLNGAPGAQGPQGIQGIQGAAGMPGTNGLNGAPGLNGTNGISAYQVAVNNGFVGTEQQWLLSLIGASGTNGLSAYQIAVNNGFVGTESAWLATLIGPQGPAGSSSGTIGSNASYSDSEIILSNDSDDYFFRYILSNNGKYFVFSNLAFGILNSNFQTTVTNVGKVWVVKYENGVFEKIGQDFIGTYANQILGSEIGINGDGTKIFFSQKESNLTDTSLKIYDLINNNWVLNSTILNPISDGPFQMNDSGNLIVSMKINYPFTTNYSDLIIYKYNGSAWNANQFPLTGIRGGNFKINQNGDFIMVTNQNQTLDVSGGLNGRTAVYNYNGLTLTQVGGFIEGPSPLSWGQKFCISNDGFKIGISSGYWNTSLGNNTLNPVFIKTYQFNSSNSSWSQYNNDLVFSKISGVNQFIEFIDFSNNSNEILVAIQNGGTTGSSPSYNTYDYYVRYRNLNNKWSQIGSKVEVKDSGFNNYDIYFNSNIFSYFKNPPGYLIIKDFN